jgi:hyaluronoglucosaminidase
MRWSATMAELGLIEGFFGRPWSWAERRDAVHFLRPHGFAFYLYAPKADPYLRKRWQEPHPEAELAELAVLRETCRAAGTRFGIGLSPFELHLHPERGWQDRLAAKLAALAVLKPDDLAILFDDMRGDVPDLAERQAAIVHFAAERGIAGRILCCPSYYSDDPILDVAFGTRPPFYLEQLGRLLDPAIQIFWTGPEVCSREFTPGHLARVAGQLRRKPVLWDNYPVNDGARMSQHLHLRGFSGRPAANASLIAAHGVNPASQPLLSRVPLLTLAESYREGEAYDYGAAFARAARTVLGEALAERVGRDLLTLQDRGLDRLGERRKMLRERYAAFDHPAAREIAAWLDGQWNVTDELVQTQ